ncbi:epoxide hydrolase family protein [Allorhizocola rhizosphaerae]|uniref:epoxide hydrolase family protein n=1 Tax=Allorhizocola rhizosphaerae TaxID=1872709 RepID=UPI000E3BC5C1|nr:epoxide hydrolase family protein [Allorhizocola rhizosphaerae]
MRFTIDVSDAELDDLKRRIRQTRWPDQIPGIGWDQGADLGYLQKILHHWAEEFDWRRQERRLNSFEHHLVDDVHFVRARAKGGDGIPLVLTHGWPSCFTEYLALVPLLSDPQAHGIDGPAFDLVIPSLPGYGFSPRPPQTGVNYRFVAQRWHRLMTGLGYERYGAGGGDFGAGVASFLALDFPESVIGLHLTTPELTPPFTDEDAAFAAEVERWSATERGYTAIQSTKPQTVGYGLTDSPAGLAAWILEKWRSWTDSGGDLDARFGRDFLCTVLSVYWFSGCITTSLRDYWDNRWHHVEPQYVGVPTGFAVFRHHFVPEGEPPRSLMERLYNVHRWTVMPRGGHFAPAEEPRLTAQDIASFYGSLADVT